MEKKKPQRSRYVTLVVGAIIIYSVQKSKEVGHEATYLPCNKTLPTCILIAGITVFVRCGSIS